MRVLAFDCSTACGSVAVVEGGEMRFSETFACPRGRGGAFFEVLERAMKTGVPARIAVGIGPGSYNGLRTAITAAEGLAFATGAERVGILSLLALPCEAPEYVAVADARGGTFSFARIRDRKLIGDVELLPVDVVRERLSAETAPVWSSASLTGFDRVGIASPDAVLLATLAAGVPASTGPLEPFYLKPPHITESRKRG